MNELTTFSDSSIHFQGTEYCTGRWRGRDVILRRAGESSRLRRG